MPHVNDGAGIGQPAHISEPTRGLGSRLSRRGALGRLFSLGAAATAVVALPVAVQAAPIALTPAPLAPLAPTPPVWLTADPEFAPAFERMADALMAMQPGTRAFCLSTWAKVSEDMARPPAPHEPVAVAAPVRRKRPSFIDVADIATARIRRLLPNERRRARRWVAGLHVSDTSPVVRLRDARRTRGAERAYDFLDVAVPQDLSDPWWRQQSPFAIATHFAEVLQGTILMSDLEIERTCCHHYPDDPGSFALLVTLPTA